VWISTPLGIQLLSPSGRLVRNIPSAAFCEAVRICRDGRVLVGTYDGLAEWIRDRVTPLSQVNPALNEHVKALIDDEDGNVWLATTEGITRVQFDATGVPKVLRIRVPGGALSLTEDREGSIWIGCVDGLRRLKNARAVVWGVTEGIASNFTPSVTTHNGKVLVFAAGPNGDLTEIASGEAKHFARVVDGPSCTAADGSLWVVNRGVIDRVRNGGVDEFREGQGVPQSWISTVAETQPGELLLTVDKAGLRLWRPGGTQPYLLRDGTPFTSTFYVMTAHKDPQGVIWFGTYDGLWRANGGEVTRYVNSTGETSNRQWYLDHPQSSKWFRTVVSDDMPDYWISGIDDDGQGTLWVGSNRGGLARLRDGHFVGFTTRDGVPTDEIFSVQLDAHRNVWLGTPTGIFEVLADDLERVATHRGEKLRPIAFGTVDGMRSEECLNVYNPASALSPDGLVWFATRDGVVSIDTEERRRNRAPPPVHIEEILVDGVLAPAGSHIRVPAGYNQIEIHFTAPSLASPERVHLKYQLEGYDQTWVNANRTRTAHYSRLPPAIYEFRAMAANEDGVWNDASASVKIEIVPFFYQTTWFIVLCTGLLTLAAFAVHLWRVRELRQREAELENRVAVRTAELSRTNEVLKKEISDRERAEAEVISANRELMIAAHRAGMAEVAEDVLHNVGNAMTSVNVSAELLSKIARHDTVAKLERTADLLDANQHTLQEFLGPRGKGHSLPKYLHALATQMSNERDAIATEVSHLQTYVGGIISMLSEQQHLAGIGGPDESVDLRDIVRQVLQLRQASFAHDRIAVDLRLGDSVGAIRAERYKVLQIVTNLLDHAHQALTDCTRSDRRIAVSVDGGAEGITLRIADNGPLRDAETLNLFAQRFEKGGSGDRYRLHVMAVLVTKIGGSVRAEAASADCGTAFVVEFHTGDASGATGTQSTLARSGTEPHVTA
jgi:ligand-binding sensor domain-containing protein/signal transduction histidine kinase